MTELLVSFNRFRQPGELTASCRDLYERLGRVSGVIGVGATSSFPLRTDRGATPLVRLDGPLVQPNRPPVVSRQRIVSRGFFDAMGALESKFPHVRGLGPLNMVPIILSDPPHPTTTGRAPSHRSLCSSY
jgi:hypothetical protein